MNGTLEFNIYNRIQYFLNHCMKLLSVMALVFSKNPGLIFHTNNVGIRSPSSCASYLFSQIFMQSFTNVLVNVFFLFWVHDEANEYMMQTMPWERKYVLLDSQSFKPP